MHIEAFNMKKPRIVVKQLMCEVMSKAFRTSELLKRSEAVLVGGGGLVKVR